MDPEPEQEAADETAVQGEAEPADEAAPKPGNFVQVPWVRCWQKEKLPILRRLWLLRFGQPQIH